MLPTTSLTTPASPPQPHSAPPPSRASKPLFEALPKRPQRNRARRWIWIGVLGAAVLALLAGSLYWWLGSSAATSTEITAAVVRADLPVVVSERGELESSKTVDARCDVEGRQIKIVEILPEGTQVTKGQVVVRFDADELTRQHGEQSVKLRQAEGKAKAAAGELEVQKNKAESEVAKAELAKKLAELDLQKYIEGEYVVELQERKGDIALAERELQDAKEKLQHFERLVKDGFVPREQKQLKEQEVKQKEFVLESKKAKLMVLEKYTKVRQEAELSAKAKEAERELERTKKTNEASLEKAKSELEASEITVKLERAALERLEKQLARCEVKAPQDGILVYSKERYWDPSSRIQAGGVVHFQQTLFSLPDLARMQVKTKIHESVVKKIQKGHKVEIRVDAYPDKVLHGTVEKVATLANNERHWDEGAVKEYVTIVTVNDLPAEAGLKPGMTAEVKILVNHLPNVLMVPVQAVTEKEGKHCVYVHNGRQVACRPVTVGENNEKFVQIKEGLEEGDRVMLDARARMAEETKGSEGQARPAGPEPGKSTPLVSAR